jgi:hypothetical protein
MYKFFIFIMVVLIYIFSVGTAIFGIHCLMQSLMI